MTPPEDFEAELMRLAREHPLFPLFVTYGLEYLSQRLDLLSDIHIFAMFGGRMDPDSIKSDLGRSGNCSTMRLPIALRIHNSPLFQTILSKIMEYDLPIILPRDEPWLLPAGAYGENCGAM